jgi:hypothetical protein
VKEGLVQKKKSAAAAAAAADGKTPSKPGKEKPAKKSVLGAKRKLKSDKPKSK